MPVAIAYLKCS